MQCACAPLLHDTMQVLAAAQEELNVVMIQFLAVACPKQQHGAKKRKLDVCGRRRATPLSPYPHSPGGSQPGAHPRLAPALVLAVCMGQ